MLYKYFKSLEQRAKLRRNNFDKRALTLQNEFIVKLTSSQKASNKLNGRNSTLYQNNPHLKSTRNCMNDQKLEIIKHYCFLQFRQYSDGIVGRAQITNNSPVFFNLSLRNIINLKEKTFTFTTITFIVKFNYRCYREKYQPT